MGTFEYNGSCLVAIQLDRDEVATVDSPEPVFILIPRISYISAYSASIAEHFSDFVINSSDGAGYVARGDAPNHF